MSDIADYFLNLNEDSIDHDIKIAEDVLDRAIKRLNKVELNYQTALSQKVIAANQLMDLILKRKNLK